MFFMFISFQMLCFVSLVVCSGLQCQLRIRAKLQSRVHDFYTLPPLCAISSCHKAGGFDDAIYFQLRNEVLYQRALCLTAVVLIENPL